MDKRFPRYLSSPFQILWFESDELGIMSVFFILALMFGYVFWALMFIAPYIYSTIKRKYPRGFFKHFLYFAGLTNLKGYPSFFQDRFCE